MQVPLSHPVDVAGFHSEATRLLALQVLPGDVCWSAPPAQAVGEEPLDAGRAAIRNRAARAIIPQSFVRMSELVVLHRDPQRFDLLYRTLWRLVYEPELRRDAADPDLARLRQMAQAVRRDIQKVKARLAFCTVRVKGRSLPVAWHEPSHYVCESVGVALARGDPSKAWILLTPDRCMRWDGELLLNAPGLATPPPGRPGPDWAPLLDALSWT